MYIMVVGIIVVILYLVVDIVLTILETKNNKYKNKINKIRITTGIISVLIMLFSIILWLIMR